MSDSVTSWTSWTCDLGHAVACQASLSFTISWSCAQTQCWWCHPTISSVVPFFSCFQPFPASGSFPMSQPFASDGQSIGFDFRISSFNEYSGLISFRIDWLVWSPCFPRDSQESSPAPQFEGINILVLSLLYGPTHNLFMATGKTIALTIQTFVDKVMSLPFNMLSRFAIAFLPRSTCLLICDCYYFHFFKTEFYFILKAVHSLYSNNRITQFP